MPLVQLAQGTTTDGLQSAAPVEAGLPEQTPVQLSLRLRTGAETVAPALDWALRAAGLQPWQGAGTIASGSALDQTVTVRWTKASVGLPVIAAILAGGVAAVLVGVDIPAWVLAVLAAAVVAAILLLAWKFFRRVAATVGGALRSSAPYALPVLAAAAAVYLLLELSGETPVPISLRKHLQARSGSASAGA